MAHDESEKELTPEELVLMNKLIAAGAIRVTLPGPKSTIAIAVAEEAGLKVVVLDELAPAPLPWLELLKDAAVTVRELEEDRRHLEMCFEVVEESDGERGIEELNDLLAGVDRLNVRSQALCYGEDVDAFLGDLEVECAEDVFDALDGIILECARVLTHRKEG